MALAAKTMHEYDGTAAAMPRGMQQHYHGTQQGDPAKAAQAMLTAIDSPNPPVHLLLGPDAVALARRKLAEIGAEVTAWEQLSSSTNYSN